MEWLTELIQSYNITWQKVAVGFFLFIITFAGSIALVSYLLVNIPATYFQASYPREFLVKRHRALRWTGIIAKNIAGFLLVVLGVIMSLPGVPGQGILTILLGVMLLDFPGKRQLETRIVRQPKVFRTINNLRQRFGRPPLVLD